MKAIVGKFFCSDPDCHQYYRKISAMEYQFTQIEWLDSVSKKERYCVTASNVIDVGKMTINDIELAICGFYDSIGAMIDSYGKGMSVEGYAQLIAECAFENESDDNSISDEMSLEECVKFQHDWMLKNS